MTTAIFNSQKIKSHSKSLNFNMGFTSNWTCLESFEGNHYPENSAIPTTDPCMKDILQETLTKLTSNRCIFFLHLQQTGGQLIHLRNWRSSMFQNNYIDFLEYINNTACKSNLLSNFAIRISIVRKRFYKRLKNFCLSMVCMYLKAFN